MNLTSPRRAAAVRLRRIRADRGSAVIEFVFVAVVVFVPLVYTAVAVAVVARDRLAAAEAARDVGRAVATTGPAEDPSRRAAAALRLSLLHHGLEPADVDLRYVTWSDACTGPAVQPGFAPGAEFAVCVLRRVRVPAVPGVLSGRGVTVIGRYVVHIDEFHSTADDK